jgi:hypothetical protein
MPDFSTLLVSVIASGGVAWLALKWTAGRLIDHGLEVHLQKHKAKLDKSAAAFEKRLEAEAEAANTRLQASLRRADDLFLGEEAAERSYRFDARKRLYGAVGPLRFQLIVACSQFLSRLASMRGEYRYQPNMQGYFGPSFLFRLGRLIALTELIENQTAYADFSVDPAMMVLLRFRSQLVRALTDADVPRNHPKANWRTQKEHIFRDQLSVIAVSMIVREENGAQRAIRYDEFVAHFKMGKGYLEPLTGMVTRLDPSGTPIFWLRLLAIGQACQGLLDIEPIAEAMDRTPFAYSGLLDESADAFVRKNRKAYADMLEGYRTKVAQPVKAPPAPRQKLTRKSPLRSAAK